MNAFALRLLIITLDRITDGLIAADRKLTAVSTADAGHGTDQTGTERHECENK